MTLQDTAGVLNMLRAAYPNYYARASREEQDGVLKLWHKCFEADSRDVVIAAVLEDINENTSGYPPAIGQVRERIRTLNNMAAGTHSITAAEALAKVKKAVRNGSYGYVEEYAKLPPELQAVVGSSYQLKEWAQLNTQDFDTVVASYIQRGFREYSTMQQREKNLPPMVMEIVAKLALQMRMPVELSAESEDDSFDSAKTGSKVQ